MRGETRGAWPSSRAAWKNKPGIITVNLRRRHADRFRRGRLAREPLPVETSQICPPRVRDAIIGARAAFERADARAPADLALATEAAEVMGSLTESTELAQALLARPVLARAALTPEQTAGIVGQGATEIAGALLRLGTLGLPRDWSPAQGLDPRQAETLRKMLLAVVSDPRLVLARLAEELVVLRHARELPAAERERRALEARAIYAPLANRLGVWQLKWELEDLAFRYLEPEEYKRVAAALNERRADRERYIETLCAELREGLAAAGIAAEVYGRPKHIYSIYRKMQRKQLAFEQLFDVRAVRLVVASIPECYAALGIVHGLWPYIPGEFDDYVATPKGNGYRSIHTAVIGPHGRSVEVQIRTAEMHEHSELGVAAHWTYKEGGVRDAQYQRKIEWVRRLLEPQEGLDAGASADGDLIEGMRTELFADRVYVLTPKGEVIDLPRGATPLDFAYSVHTSLGHRCRGAKANGRIVPLTHTLANGEVVEIITGKHDAPSRDWLAPEQGYLVSARNRSKVRAWFRKQDVGGNRSAGRAIAERELARIGVRPEQLGALTAELKAPDTDHLYQLLGEGEITVTQLVQAAMRLTEPPRPPLRPARPAATRRRASPVEIEGVGDLPTTLARCCAPLRPQPINGYVTLGRGVTVHRSDCAGFQRMSALKPDRVLKVEWSSAESGALAVELAVSAYDRRGLLRDLTDVLAVERLSIDAASSRTDHDAGIAYFDLSVAVDDLEQLARVLRRLAGVPNVIEARRRR
ncbi:MAG: bifunctional (p)ppGpp synthetase/guanosine-3',5'-bis(diphosphate) 3'-pyrophosphohydrolase [Gammaproteobacteria bacterium]|nr:MAG: bifunctional (p)ppGpp synthetase/guanosine-3',5'-bis(diphosphate) 3'-pyrophosphohydrolase [Gammaproteobacteria bacterium]